MVGTPFDSAQGPLNPERGSTPLTIEGQWRRSSGVEIFPRRSIPSVVRLRSPSRDSREDRAESRSSANPQFIIQLSHCFNFTRWKYKVLKVINDALHYFPFLDSARNG